MTPKQYLMQAKHLDALIDARLREIDYWRDMSTSISGPRFDGMPHSPNRPADAGFVRCLEKVSEIQTDVERKVAKLITLRDDINRRIDTIDSPEEQLVLRYRYVDNCTWEEIESLMNVSERTVFRIHGSALQHFPMPDES
jgi:DNA-directed RNA polymerase specialized sigma24 family protein